jgi:Putative lumazine-binding
MTDARTDADRDAIVAAALDYYEGWFDGNAMRMERALHPELAKRGLTEDEKVETDTARSMIDATADGVGRKRDVPDRRIEVDVNHMHGDIASAVVTSAVYVDYLHLVRVGGRWKIVNALWAGV